MSPAPGEDLYGLTVTTIAGVPQGMEVYRGRGLAILGFPRDQFGHQYRLPSLKRRGLFWPRHTPASIGRILAPLLP